MALSFSSLNSVTRTISRPQTTIIVVASFLAIFAAYKIVHHDFFPESSQPSNNSIHRSNAVRRRQRAGTNSTGSDNVVPNLHLDDSDQVEETRFVLVDQNPIETDNIIENSASHDEYGWSLPHTHERNGQNIVQLLFRVSEDATKRNAYIHRGCACNCCGMVPIRGIRYRCANCADYDLCENCEAQSVHTKTHIFYKIKVPVSGIGPRNMQPVWYIGDPDSVNRQLSRDTLIKLSMETGFERPELEAQWEQWTFMANSEWREDPLKIYLAMDRKTFERCLVPTIAYRHASPYLIFDRMFAFYDSNKDDLIGFSEFIHGLAFRKKKDKWKKIFEGYDIDGDGYVDRKDFLRIFRSYYVLCRSLHAEMLDGMVEQQMSGADAHRLVGSRQPLSSLFGQDGRFPPAPNPRIGEGKSVQKNGDLEIIDGKGVITESSLDHGNRHEVFKHECMKRTLPGDTSNFRGYWETILRLPETAEQLQSSISQIRIIPPLSNDQFREPLDSADPQVDSQDVEQPNLQTHPDNNGATHIDHDDDSWPPNCVAVTDENAEAVEGPGTRVEDVCRSSRHDVIAQTYPRTRFHEDGMFEFLPQSQEDAIIESRTQQDIYMRWQRRHFYTEEEEGEKPPAGWKDDYDILVQNDIIEGSSKQSRPSLHSRSSSSKVHFAEDMNDFDIRSNPSTSSRSVPERWGGLEIPDAEKDAGKEILYQITQQAFNELLDILFKDKEDLAIQAAATKSMRERYRHLYMTPDFHEWAISQILQEPQVEIDKNNLPFRSLNKTTAHQYDSKDESEAPLSGNLEDLSNTVAARIEDNSNLSQGDIFQSSKLEPTTRGSNTKSQSTSETELLNIIAHYDDDEDQKSPRAISLVDILQDESLLLPIYRDPTMPQFRPNTSQRTSVDYDCHVLRSDSCQEKIFNDRERNLNGNGEQNHILVDQTLESEGQTKIAHEEFSRAQDQEPKLDEISKEHLFKFWVYEKAAKDAERRGGWGRLNFKEFERRVKMELKKEKNERQFVERTTPRMDYLGSWIEFCIP